MATTFQINPYLELKLEQGKTNIYVDGGFFQHCKYLLLNVTINDIEVETIESIDEAAGYLDHSLEPEEEEEDKELEIYVAPNVEFWGHSSNMQAWYEHNYDTRLIHRDLAFPLLKELTDAGDDMARKVFKKEIASRLESRYLPVIIYLLEEGYLDYLTFDEIAAIQFDRIDCMFDLLQEYYEKNKKERNKNGYIINLDAIYEYIKTLIPRNAREWNGKAIIYNILKLPEEEYNCFRNAIKQHPNNVNILTGLMKLEFKRDNIDEVGKISRTLMRIEPVDAGICFGAGMFYWNNDNYLKAIPCFKKALELEPQNHKFILQLAMAYNCEGNEIKCDSILLKALEKFQSDKEICMEIGKCCYDMNNYDLALLAYKYALRIAPASINCWKALSITYYDIEKYLHARRCTRKAIRLSSDISILAKAYSFLALIYRDQSKYEMVLKSLDKSLEYNPENYHEWSNKALIYNVLHRAEMEAYCQQKADEIKKKKLSQQSEFDDSKLDYILHLSLPRGKELSHYFETSDDDAKLALTLWADHIEIALEKIRRLIGKFEGKELNFTSMHPNFVSLDGDKMLLKEAVEEDLVCLEDYEELLNEAAKYLYR